MKKVISFITLSMITLSMFSCQNESDAIAPQKQIVEQYQLVGTVYQLVKKHAATDIIDCIVLKNLSFSVAAIFEKEANRAAIAHIVTSK